MKCNANNVELIKKNAGMGYNSIKCWNHYMADYMSYSVIVFINKTALVQRRLLVER